MHETPKYVLINNFYFHKVIVMHVWSVSNMASDYPYTIALKIMVLSLSDGQVEPKMDEKNCVMQP